MKLWRRIVAWYRGLGSKCRYCGAGDAENGICKRKECVDKATEWQSFAP